jgi:hypothetical protein
MEQGWHKEDDTMALPGDDHQQMKVNLFILLDKQLPDNGPCRIMSNQYVEQEHAASTRCVSSSPAIWLIGTGTISQNQRRIVV